MRIRRLWEKLEDKKPETKKIADKKVVAEKIEDKKPAAKKMCIRDRYEDMEAQGKGSLGTQALVQYYQW